MGGLGDAWASDGNAASANCSRSRARSRTAQSTCRRSRRASRCRRACSMPAGAVIVVPTALNCAKWLQRSKEGAEPSAIFRARREPGSVYYKREATSLRATGFDLGLGGGGRRRGRAAVGSARAPCGARRLRSAAACRGAGAREDAVAASNCERVRSAQAPPSTQFHHSSDARRAARRAAARALHVALLNCDRACTVKSAAAQLAQRLSAVVAAPARRRRRAGAARARSRPQISR